MQAKAVWVDHLDDYHLLGLKFARPLHTDAAAVSGQHLRKVAYCGVKCFSLPRPVSGWHFGAMPDPLLSAL